MAEYLLKSKTFITHKNILNSIIYQEFFCLFGRKSRLLADNIESPP
jgi:hypothetical protein